jgi:N-methylhydantoinase A/oxoprolinase/acetone carboxylase beta subunit
VSFRGENYIAEEEQLRKAMLRAFPRHLLGSVPVLYSSVLSRDENSNTRLWTAIFNAFLHPAMERFLYNTENELSTFRMRNPLLVYRNDGYSGRVAKTIALKTYSSGPRGGAEGALAYCDYYAYKRVITIDVGGTTTDIGLIENGEIVGKQRGLVEGVRCSYPLAEIVSVGVGGGSIIRVVDGEIAVGPESVGGAPGPACFGMGGEHATITDALLVMGLLDPKTYFGGKMAIKHEKAVAVIHSNIAQPLNISLEAACGRMLDAWAAKIARGIRDYTEITDDTVLMAFGGGGPMGVTAVARSAGVRQVLIPRLSAVFSAHGIGFSDIAHSATAQIDGTQSDKAAPIIDGLVDRVSRDMSTEGYSREECDLQAWYEDDGGVHAVDMAKFGRGNTDFLPPKNVLFGVRAVMPISHAQLAPNIAVSPSTAVASGERRLVAVDGKTQTVPVYQVEKQKAGAGGVGGAVLEEAFWTCSVPPEWRFDFTANRDIVLSFNTCEQVQ